MTGKTQWPWSCIHVYIILCSASNTYVKCDFTSESTSLEPIASTKLEYKINDTHENEQQLDDKILFLQHILLNVMTYVPPILLSLGLVGNTLTVIVLSRPGMKSGSSVILIALAVADTLALALGPITSYTKTVHNINIDNESYFICKTHRYLKSVFSLCANWLIVVFTLFRVIAVYWPHKANIYCSRKRAYIAVATTFLVCCFGNLDSIISKQLMNVYNHHGEKIGSNCWFPGDHGEFYRHQYQWIHMAFISLAPFTILLIGNLMIIYKMIKYRDLRRQLSNDNKTSESQSLTAMLISISLLFLVTQTPAIIFSNIRNSKAISPNRALMDLVYSVFNLLRFSNNAVNFLCYCISGKKFREELMCACTEWVLCRKRKLENDKPLETVVTSVH